MRSSGQYGERGLTSRAGSAFSTSTQVSSLWSPPSRAFHAKPSAPQEPHTGRAEACCPLQELCFVVCFLAAARTGLQLKQPHLTRDWAVHAAVAKGSLGSSPMSLPISYLTLSKTLISQCLRFCAYKVALIMTPALLSSKLL